MFSPSGARRRPPPRARRHAGVRRPLPRQAAGNGQCVVLAEGAGEDEVVLPLAVFEHNPNVDVSSTGAAHPLHVLVHKGVPGDRGTYAVYGSAAGDLCAAGYVNH